METTAPFSVSGEKSAERPTASQEDYLNVAPAERRYSMIAGGALALYGLTRFSLKGLALAAAGGAMIYRGVTGHCPAYSALGINTSRPGDIRIAETVTIQRSPEELYAFWRDLENLPMFMRHLESVRNIDGTRSQWTARLPGGIGTLSWEAEVTEARQWESISWRSLPGAPVENTGTVRFSPAPGDRGTEMQVDILYHPPAGGLGAAAARLFNPALSQMIREDIRRFKSLMEAGEVPTVEGQPAGTLH